ncbi:MAG: MATE family efflux transporter [Myxococcota bacterium]
MLTRRRVLALAWPVVLAQTASATTGVVDTAAITRTGDAVDLSAVAVAAVSFSFLYWGFGFLRMSTTGLTAQAAGAGDVPGIRAVLLRALLVGGTVGAALVVTMPALRGTRSSSTPPRRRGRRPQPTSSPASAAPPPR